MKATGLAILISAGSPTTRKVNCPGILQQNLNVPQPLRHDAGDFECSLPLARAAMFTADERRQKLRIEATRFLAQVVMSRGWMIVSEEFFRKSSS